MYEIVLDDGRKVARFSLENFKRLYGEVDGERKYKEVRDTIRKKNTKPKKTIFCMGCEKELIIRQNSKQKYCSFECASKHQKKIGLRKNKANLTLEHYIERFGEIEGRRKFEIRSINLSKALKGKKSWNKGKTFEDIHGERADIIKKQISETEKKTKEKNRLERNNIKKREIKDHEKSKKQKGMWSLSWFIERYGKEKGEQLYNERCSNISKTSYFRIYNKTNKRNFSKISQELFWKIYNKLPNEYQKTCYFGELNHEYGAETDTNFDFVCIFKKRIIEFYGDNVHGNPLFYKDDDVLFHLITSKDKHTLDEIKNMKAINNGYEILIVWENEYKKDTKGTLYKCQNFLIS